jgi:hypothetical protein
MRNVDFSSWQGVFSTLLGLAVVTLLGVGIRVLMMQTIQQRRERMNRQINERLRTLIAAYKVLGGSFTADLVISLRAFVREALDLGPMPGDVVIPLQGPTRTQAGAGRGKGEGGAGGGGMGMGLGMGLGHGHAGLPDHDQDH